jgi:hypothetical protein
MKLKNFIVEWEKDFTRGQYSVIRVMSLDEFIKIPVSERTWSFSSIMARDELDAYKKAMQEEQTDEQ